MAKTKISEFSSTPANNTDIDSINIAEGCAPSGINNAIRELMAQLKDFQTGAAGDSFNGPVGTTTAAAGAFTTLSASGTVTLNGGTANGVAYLNGSKVLTTGSALTFDGTSFGVTGRVAVSQGLSLGSAFNLTWGGAYGAGIPTITADGANGFQFYPSGSTSGEQMRLTSTGLGIGTSSPSKPLDVANSGLSNHLNVQRTSVLSALTTAGSITLSGGNSTTATANIQYALIAGLAQVSTAGSESGGLVFQTKAPAGSLTERLRIDSAGNVGIGTSSPAYKLDVNGGDIRITDTFPSLLLNGTTGGVVWNFIEVASGNLETRANDITRLSLTSSGNLGLGVTPSAWGGVLGSAMYETRNAMHFGSINSTSSIGYIGVNAYYDGTNWVYKNSSQESCRYELNSNSTGAHAWFTAPSGTAGNAISFTQAMTLDASGNLLVGRTGASNTPDSGLSLNTGSNAVGSSAIAIGHVNGSASGDKYAWFNYNGTTIGSITQSGTTATAYNTSSDYRLKNITGPITTSGAYIDSLNPVEGTWKADGSTFVGLIAHEVQEASRTQVATGVKDGEEMQGMDYSSAEIIANLIAEVKSLRTRVAALEAA